MPRVSYIWSRELQEAADQLPSNIGRSSVVHDLIDSFGLLRHMREQKDNGKRSESASHASSLTVNYFELQSEQKEVVTTLGSNTASTTRARVVSPNMELGSVEMMKRYHDPKYVGSFSLWSYFSLSQWSH
jgi:histone deacetylase 1/2